MADYLQIPGPQRADLIILLSNERPLHTRDLGDLLVLLGRDYRAQFPGRELVIARLETGSIKLVLTDLAAMMATHAKGAAEIIKGATAIVQLGTSLRDFFKRKGEPQDSGSNPDAYTRSAEKMVQIAVRSGSGIEIEVTATSIKCKIPPDEVRQSDLRQRKIRDQRRAIAPRANRALLGFDKATESAWLDSATARIASASEAQVSDIIAQIADALDRISMLDIATSIERRLRASGRHELADQLEAEVARRGGQGSQ